MDKQATLFDGDIDVLDRLRNPVLTARVGKNGPLFADICRLYVPDGSRVLDMTYGLGGFWTMRGLVERYDLVKMDLERPAVTVRAALEHLPFKADSFDCAVLDPPYANNGSDAPIKSSIAQTYNLKAGNANKNILNYYINGGNQAWRVLRPNGSLIVKCQDEVESGKQQWNHISVLREAALAGFYAEDLFVLVQDGSPAMRHNYQLHARKNHSYFWVFRKA